MGTAVRCHLSWTDIGQALRGLQSAAMDPKFSGGPMDDKKQHLINMQLGTQKLKTLLMPYVTSR